MVAFLYALNAGNLRSKGTGFCAALRIDILLRPGIERGSCISRAVETGQLDVSLFSRLHELMWPHVSIAAWKAKEQGRTWGFLAVRP